ncbi:AP-4 complex subunit epsilon [Thraustotheca clavata]|uniref:AP-4 complex subunit epsilon n=1 Tax=Thraustotheca clavata TaxID=74557 RepID=A0A1V9ZX26_9STRA|nr:AP-4 complex subunit epsilon [Thraustotheca clavata]
MSGSHLSKDFFELVKSIGESKSKQEEDRIIVQEVAQLKRKMQELGAASNSNQLQANKKKQKEFLIRLMYVEMLGHDASFGYIKAVEMTAATNLIQKRVGYLTCSLTLAPTHEFRFMIINQLQRDLQSPNHLEVCSALMAVCKLVTVEMIPAVQPMIMEALRHEIELVRKKAVMALHRFHQLNPDSVADMGDTLRRTLCDRDPSVMGAALCLLHDVALVNPAAYKDLVPSYVSILKQITEHRLPREFDYHRIPAPWIQIRLLKILALLGQADQTTSEGMYEVLHDVMRRADTGINVGYAIIYECVRTVTTIYPNSTLLDAAAASISRFISSDNHNLKYLGVTGLAAIVKDHPRYATAHQMAVIDCLEDPDETLKRKTLDLLYRMTNPVNVEFIVAKLTTFLREATDVFLRTELVNRITQCAERYAPNNAWYIQTMTDVFELGGELVKEEVSHNLMRLIAEGSGDDEEQDMELRRDAVDTYLELLERPVLPDILVCTMAWVLGEYGYLSEAMDLDEIAERLCELVDRPFDNEDMTRGYIVTAVTKLTAQLQGRSLDVAQAMVEKYKTSRSIDLQQRCLEYLAMQQHPALMVQTYPVDASCEDLEIDSTLSFLQSFVDQALAQGAPRYDPPHDDEEEAYGHRHESGLNFTAYEKPELPYAGHKLPSNDPSMIPGAPLGFSGANQTSAPWGAPAVPQDAGFGARKPSVKNVWGPTGMNTGSAPESPAPNQYGQPNNPYYNNNPGYGGPAPAPSYSPNTNRYDSEEEHEPEEPVVDERAAMANALFGGLPGAGIPMPASKRTSSGPRTLSRKSTVKQSSAQAVSALPKRRSTKPESSTQSSPAPAIHMDLLDMSFDAPAAPAPSYPTMTAPSVVDPFAGAPQPDPFQLNALGSSLPSYNDPSKFQLNGRVLEPWQISTAEFGGRWGSCPSELKSKISPSSIRSLDEFCQRLHQVDINPVESIAQTNEVIAAGRFQGSDIVCLIHCKVRSGGLDLTVRTPDPAFTNGLSAFLGQVLQ